MGVVVMFEERGCVEVVVVVSIVLKALKSRMSWLAFDLSLF